MNFAILGAIRSLRGPVVSRLVQSKSGTATGTSITVTFDNTPTNGNLMVAIVNSNDGDATNPTGWNTDVNKVDVTDDDFLRIASKVAGAGESSAVTFTGFVGNNHCLDIMEFSLPSATPLDVTSSDGESLGVTSQTSGTTGTTAQASEVSIVGFHIRANVSGVSLTNGFTVRGPQFNS
ncbi:MAG TPA: hypothetical protein VE222_11665, partial [Nitrospiraceae bacterium]|nr:hypothetical protein [Nitrospiraceae bacterium]